MAARKDTTRRIKAILGAGAVVLGFLLLTVNLESMTSQVPRLVGAPMDAVGILPALGLASLHVMQAYSFDQAGFLSSLTAILVSFWPVLLILAGVLLLRSPQVAKMERNAIVMRISIEPERSHR
jgi:hypothetical protein